MTRRAVVILPFPDEFDARALDAMEASPGPIDAANRMLDLAAGVTVDYAIVDRRRHALEVGLTGPGLPRVAEHRPGGDRWIMQEWDPLICHRTPPPT